MNNAKKPQVVISLCWRNLLFRLAQPAMLFLLVLSLGNLLSAQTKHADERNETQIAVMVNFNNPSPDDEIAIRLIHNADQKVLENLVTKLSEKFHATPKNVKYDTVSGIDEQKQGTAVIFNMPIVPRTERYLPIAPFVEAFAVYTNRLRIIYSVQGSFTYKGYEKPYTDSDVAFTVDIKKTAIPNSENSLAFYEMDVNIKNPAITRTKFANYPPSAPLKKRGTPALLLAIGVAVIILGIGVGLAYLLRCRKTAQVAVTPCAEHDVTDKSENQTGGNHD